MRPAKQVRICAEYVLACVLYAVVWTVFVLIDVVGGAVDRLREWERG